MRRIFIVRHGETDWNANHRWQGWIDVPLNPVGVAQAEAAGAALAGREVPFVAVASSDLARAHHTASILARHLVVTEHLVDAGFRERFGGDWQGLTSSEIEAQFPDHLEAWRAGRLDGPPNAETVAAMLDRFDQALARLDGELASGPVLLVSHGGVQRAVARRAGATMDRVLDNLAGMWFHYGNGVLSVDTSDVAASTSLAADNVE